MRNHLRLAAFLLATSCASPRSGKRFADMTAEEHRRAAVEENRAADAHLGAIRRHEATPGRGPEGHHYPVGITSPFNGSSEPGEPEYYTIDPRIRDPDAKHVDKARKHRDRALRHEAAADSLEGRRQ